MGTVKRCLDVSGLIDSGFRHVVFFNHLVHINSKLGGTNWGRFPQLHASYILMLQT